MSLILRDPTLIDTALCAMNLRRDDQDQWCELGHEAWYPDLVATECWGYPGPKWAICSEDGMPLAVAGCQLLRKGVYRTWFLSGEELWTHGKAVTDITRKVMLEMLASDARRIETLCLASRKDARSWYEKVGLYFEAEFPNYGVTGKTVAQYAITRG